MMSLIRLGVLTVWAMMVNLTVLYLINVVEHYLQIKVECYYIV